MKRKHEPLVFARLYPPRPLDPKTVEDLLLRLAVDQPGALIALEVRAVPGEGISYWLGASAEHLRWVRRTFHDLLPGLITDKRPTASRLPVATSARVRVRPPGLALSSEQPELATRTLLSALNAKLLVGEHLVVQLLLGPRRAARHERGDAIDPHQPWWDALAHGTGQASVVVRKQMAERQHQPGFATSIRFGVRAASAERRGQLLAGLLGGFGTAKSPGVHVDLIKDKPSSLDQAIPPARWGMAPAAAELVGLLAWPLGDQELPGLPPLHPKLLPLTHALTETSRVFGISNVPGDRRPLGISPADSLFHLIALGPTGSGKTTALLHLIKADIEAGRPVIVIDPKRQLIDDVIDTAVPKERIDDVVILDPASAQPPGFNPLDVGDRDPDVVVDGLLAVFSAVFKDGWGPRTQDIINSGLLTLARVGKTRSQSFTLLDLPRLFTDQAFRTSVIGQVADDPGLGEFWAWFESLRPAGQANAVAAPLNKIRQYILRPSLRRILGQSSPKFRLRDAFRGNKIVLIPLNEGLIGPVTAQLLGSLIVAETWAATLERAAEASPTSRPASVFVDELQNYLNLPTSLGDALSTSRSMGVSWNVAHQFRAQLPPEMRAAIDSNARNKIIFGPLNPDDARDMARQAPELEALDFLSLGRYTAYSTVVVDAESQPWCSIATLPPPAHTGLGDHIRTASQTTYGTSQVMAAAKAVPPLMKDIPVGRKRRHQP